MTLWATSILISHLNQDLKSSLHLTGSLFFATLLKNTPTGVFAFIVPAFASVLVIVTSCFYHWRTTRSLPISLNNNLICGVSLSLIGALLFASQQVESVAHLYAFTHSGWHICMSLAIMFLLPKSWSLIWSKKFLTGCDNVGHNNGLNSGLKYGTSTNDVCVFELPSHSPSGDDCWLVSRTSRKMSTSSC
jgi:hypothetical protein